MGPKPLLLPGWWGFWAGGNDDVKPTEGVGTMWSLKVTHSHCAKKCKEVLSLDQPQLWVILEIIFFIRKCLFGVSGLEGSLGTLVGFSSFSISKYIRFCDILLQFSFFLGINIYFTLKLSWFWHFVLFVKFLDILSNF